MLIMSESGMPILETMSGITIPADYSFACINNFVHCENPGYEDLQNLALGMAEHIEKLEEQIACHVSAVKRANSLVDLNDMDDGPDLSNTHIPTGNTHGNALDQLYAAFHREPCGNTLAAIGTAIQVLQAMQPDSRVALQTFA